MTRLILIIVSLVLSGLIVFSAGGIVWNGTTDPTIQNLFFKQGKALATNETSKGLSQLLSDKKALNEAIANAETLKSKISKLEETQKSIKPEDLDKLDKFIPDHIDNINLIIDINNIAERHGMTIKNVKVRSGLEEEGAVPSDGAGADVAASGQNTIAETFLSFSVSGDYESLLNFLDSLANSLRVADVSSLSFTVDDKGINQYNFEIKTYWVK